MNKLHASVFLVALLMVCTASVVHLFGVCSEIHSKDDHRQR